MAFLIVRSGVDDASAWGFSTSPSSPNGRLYICLPCSVNWKLRNIPISDCGEPNHRLSVPQHTRFGPTWLISLPRRWADWSALFITDRHVEPISAYTLGTLPSPKRDASHAFSRRLLISESTPRSAEFTWSSPGYAVWVSES